MVEERPKLKIDEEFKLLLLPQTKEEYEQLVLNIAQDGCTDPIKVWAGHDIILDGHTRYRICDEKGIDFEIHYIDLETREDAVNWIINNQLGKRNLTPSQRSYLMGKRYNTEKRVAHRPAKADQSDQVTTADKIAAESKTGPATVRRNAEYATAIDQLRQDAGQEFCQRLLTEQIKLPKSDIMKLAAKPNDERKAVIAEIQQGAKGLTQAETAVKVKSSPADIFEIAGPDLEFADYIWDPKKLDVPKNTKAQSTGPEAKPKFVYLKSDIFEETFTDDERTRIVQVMRYSPQWIFMVHTKSPERVLGIDWPANICVGCHVDSQSGAEQAWEIFEKITNVTRFVICDLHKESIAFDGLSAFDWVIITSQSKIKTPWQRVESVLDQALADSLCIYWMPSVTARPKDRPRFQTAEVEREIQNVEIQDSIQATA